MTKATVFLLLGLLPLTGYPTAGQLIPLDTKIELERSGGIVGPPTRYKLTILADGAVRIQGLTRGKAFGPREAKISQEDVSRLVAEFERIGYFALKRHYMDRQDCPSVATDNSYAFTYFRINGKSKSVDHYLGCRGAGGLEELTALEKLIDEIAGTQRHLRSP